MAAGHVIECGAQATGGNYSFFAEIDDLRHPGFPIAEIFADGSSVITKHPGTGGAVTVGTVTAQLLYEVAGPRYAGPDATLRLDTVQLRQDGPDRVAISGVRGEPPPPTLKVSLNTLGGYRNQVEFVLTGLDIEAKAALVRDQLAGAFPPDVQWELARTDHADASTEEQASATLRCVARGADAKAIGRAFSGAAVELALASYPGFHLTAPPGDAQPYGVFTAAYLDRAEVQQVAVLPDGGPCRCPSRPRPRRLHPVEAARRAGPGPVPAPVRRAPLGTVAGARSGDKGGDANVGVWARDEAAWPWLAATLTVEQAPRAAAGGGRRCRSPGICCRTCARSTSSSRDCSARASPRRPGSTRRPRRSASGCAPATSTYPRPCSAGAAAVTALRSAVDDKSAGYAANREAMLAKLAEVAAEQAKAIAGGGPKYIDRHRGRGKLLVARADRAAAGSRQPVPGTVTARGLGDASSRSAPAWSPGSAWSRASSA